MRERPAGITILAILFFALGVLSLLWGLLVLGVGGVSALFGNLFNAQNLTTFGNTSGWSGFLGILSGIVQLVVGVGLLGMRKWGWYLALIGVALDVITGVVGIFQGGVYTFICGSLGLILPAIILIYLLTRGVRSAFGIGGSS